MESRLLTCPVVLIAIVAVISMLLGCAPRTGQLDATNTSPRAIPELASDVEVEVLAAQLAGRGDVALVFLLGHEGRIIKRAGLQSSQPPELIARPTGPAVDPKDPSLSETESIAVMDRVWDAIVAASTPEEFDAPDDFRPPYQRPWHHVNPPVRLRVNMEWLNSEASTFDGTWLILTSSPVPAGDRVVLNVVGSRDSMRRSGGTEVLLSRGFLPEAITVIPLGSQHGPKARELWLAVHAHASEDVLPDAEILTVAGVMPWRAISGVLRVEIDRSLFEGMLTRARSRPAVGKATADKRFERWTIVEDRRTSR
jgi:hypothetical protein